MTRFFAGWWASQVARASAITWCWRGKVGVTDNIFIGDNVIAGGGTIILANVPKGRVVLGYPAMKMDTTMDVFKGMRRLKRLFDDVASLKKTVSNGSQSD